MANRKAEFLLASSPLSMAQKMAFGADYPTPT
jgi:hypothetical protein